MAPDRPIDALIDHAASLQRQVDQLSREVTILGLAGLFLAVALCVVMARSWDDE
jgi:hypothetical protein